MNLRISKLREGTWNYLKKQFFPAMSSFLSFFLIKQDAEYRSLKHNLRQNCAGHQRFSIFIFQNSIRLNQHTARYLFLNRITTYLKILRYFQYRLVCENVLLHQFLIGFEDWTQTYLRTHKIQLKVFMMMKNPRYNKMFESNYGIPLLW